MDPSTDSEFQDSAESDITPRDSNILQAIQEEGLMVFTFDGLRRLLGVHQETLSRVLDRLEAAGLVEKAPDGYRLTSEAQTFARPLSSDIARVPIVQALLPEDVLVGRMVEALKGRWFGRLRWVGYSETQDGMVLKWVTDDDGVLVGARFADPYLTIEAKIDDGKEIASAVKASHQLLGYISRLYNRPRKTGRFASPVSYYPDLAAVWAVTWS